MHAWKGWMKEGHERNRSIHHAATIYLYQGINERRLLFRGVKGGVVGGV